MPILIQNCLANSTSELALDPRGRGNPCLRKVKLERKRGKGGEIGGKGDGESGEGPGLAAEGLREERGARPEHAADLEGLHLAPVPTTRV